MAKYALIKNNKVENIILAGENIVDKIAQNYDEVINVTDTPEAKIGFNYDGENFSSPEEALIEDENVVVDLDQLKADKTDEIRKQRNELLKKTDEKWIEAFSKKEYRTPIENDKDILRDLMATVQQEVNSMTEESQIEEYDPISSLELNNNYGDE